MIRQSAGKDFAYILGVYLGDGCVTYTGYVGCLSFRLNTIDRDFAEAAASALTALTGRTVNVRRYEEKRGKDFYAICLGDQPLCEGLTADTDNKAKIPDYVSGWSKEEKLAFIAGLMDSEGFVGANKSNPTNRRYYMGFKCCSVWVPDFARLLETIGLRIGKISVCPPYREGYKVPIRFHIKMQSWIDAGCYFNIERKNARVREWASFGAYERRKHHPRRSTSETLRRAHSWDDKVRTRRESARG